MTATAPWASPFHKARNNSFVTDPHSRVYLSATSSRCSQRKRVAPIRQRTLEHSGMPRSPFPMPEREGVPHPRRALFRPRVSRFADAQGRLGMLYIDSTVLMTQIKRACVSAPLGGPSRGSPALHRVSGPAFRGPSAGRECARQADRRLRARRVPRYVKKGRVLADLAG